MRYPPASFDSVILAAVVAECRDLAGARVQRVVQTGPDTLALGLRAGRRRRLLVVSGHGRWARFHLAGEVPQSEPAPFTQMVRGRLERAVVRSIDMPPFERIVRLEFETLEGPCELIAELIGRHANILLCQDGVIVGALRQVRSDPADQTRREIVPGKPYALPAQGRPTPATITTEHLSGDASAEAWRAVLAAVAGIGPALAHEACLRAGIDPGAPLSADATGRLVAALRDIADTVAARRFAPVLYLTADGDAQAYGAFPMLIYRGLREERASMSAAVEVVTAGAADRAHLDVLRQGLASTITQAVARTHRALDAVARDLKGAEEAGRYRQQGELLLAYLSQVAPGASSIEVPDFDGRPAQITVDPARSGVENAQVYFRRYARGQAALKRLPARRADLEAELAYLHTAATAISQAETADDLVELEHDLVAAGLHRRRRPPARPKAVAARRVFQSGDGAQIMVGRSARENDHLTFEVAGPDDLWLHARGMPGAHVIVKTTGRPAADDLIEAAARVAAYYSAGRGSGKVPVDVTQRRFVRRIRGGRPGQVHYTNERTLVVSPGLPVEALTRG